MVDPIQGFLEIEHTADWALRVWAPDIDELFRQAAIGMNALAEIRLQEGLAVKEVVDLQAIDMESLLVAFLTEIVLFGEVGNLGFSSFEIKIEGFSLLATLSGGTIVSRKKEIKAVTYHNLAIVQTDNGFSVEIVFDV
jgi:SHS2 domain-containing protein